MNENGLDLLRAHFADSPEALAFVAAHFEAGEPGDPAALLSGADESDFSLAQWVEALELLGHWLEGKGQALSMRDQIGYVACAAEGAGAGAHLTNLRALVGEMLAAYGCERAVKK